MDDPHSSFVPWSKRNTTPEPKTKERLTNKAQTRLANVVSGYSERRVMLKTHSKYEGEFGSVKVDFKQNDSIHDLHRKQTRLLKNESRDKALTYLELLLNTAWSRSERQNQIQSLMKMDDNIRRVLTEERILLELKPSRDMLPLVETEDEFGKETEKLYDPEEFGPFQFEKLADQSFVEADQELRALTKGERWEAALTGYNEAWELYEEGTFTYVIAEKLYNSLELVAQKICVELEGWENEDQTLGTYINRMREEGLFVPNDEMVGEWQQILNGVKTGVNRTGSDRKRHESIDQDYAILLIHQVASFLSFIIKRYESQCGDTL